MARKNYTDEFRRRAVDLYESTPGATLKGIAVDLGISRGALKEWVDKLVSESWFPQLETLDVADALKAKGFAVEKSAVRMPDGPLKAVGESQIVVALHTDVTATISVVVVGEN